MKRMKEVRITKEEFELDDGTIQPMMLDIDKTENINSIYTIELPNYRQSSVSEQKPLECLAGK